MAKDFGNVPGPEGPAEDGAKSTAGNAGSPASPADGDDSSAVGRTNKYIGETEKNLSTGRKPAAKSPADDAERRRFIKGAPGKE
ncbi:MAG: hypothetical protein M3Q09_01965 [Gemmatimonadota bacterium]|nr:hypothetical protein [Gemmatimonadota bacterium]